MSQYTNITESKITEEDIEKSLKAIESIQQKFTIYCNKNQEVQINNLISSVSNLTYKVKQIIGTEYVKLNKMIIIPMEDNMIMSNLIIRRR